MAVIKFEFFGCVIISLVMLALGIASILSGPDTLVYESLKEEVTNGQEQQEVEINEVIEQ